MRVTLLFACFALLVTLGITPPRSASAAPDNTRGMSILSAGVSRTGILVNSAGATQVIKPAAGIYGVVFERDVTACYYVPTLSNNNFSFTAGSASAGLTDNGNIVVVGVADTNGAFADIAFHLLVFCNR